MRPAPRWLALFAAAAAAVPASAQDPGDVPARTFALHCGTLLVGDGTTALRDAWLVVQDGKVKSVSTQAPPADLPVVDAGTRVVMPGIVAVDSDLATAADSDYQYTPDAQALDQFDFERNMVVALQGGVTTAYLSPGRQRLVSGQGAVVKLAGQDLVARVLADSAFLRVNFNESAINAPRVFEPTAHPTDADPLLPARIQTPTARISVLAELRAAFAAATDKNKAAGGKGPAENRYDERPLADVIAGKLPVRAAAFLANDIRRALTLQQELGVRMVLENPQEIADLAALAAGQKVAATFRMPMRFGRAGLPGVGEDRLQKTPEPRPDAPAKAAAAGMLVGIGPASDVPLRDYLLAVGLAVRHGLPADKALRGVGADAAAILGVDKRVGTLAVGKDADFVVLSGEPLAIGTIVEQTWIDGVRVWAKKGSSKALAVRAGLVHDGQGRTLRNGVVLMQDGRIKGVGEDLAIPYGAEVIDLPNAVVTPGFVDAQSYLGLAGEGTPVPPGAANQQLHTAIAFDDPMFAGALAEGITTALVSGRDGGRITAIKTGARAQDAMTVRAIAGLRLAHDGIGPDAIRGFAEQVNRGKQYVESWRKYEKDLAEWQNKKPAAAPAPAPTPPPAGDAGKPESAPEDPVSGVWEAELNVQGQLQLKVTLDLKLSGTKVDGTIKISFSGRDLQPQPLAGGSFEGGKLKLQFRGMGGEASLEGTVSGDSMSGKMTLGRMGEQDITARRTSKTSTAPAPRRPAASAKPDEAGKPKAPKVDENLEPMRAAIEKRAALVVRTNRGGAIRDVTELLEKEGIPYVLQGCEDLLDDASCLAGRKPPILVGPETVQEDKGELRNTAAAFTDLDLPIVFGSGECAGAKNLPLHVAYAVRYGLSPADALAALTSWPARAFHVDDRVGSLQKGRDGDLVVFSGNPFEPASRVLLVVCNGQVVVDRREKK